MEEKCLLRRGDLDDVVYRAKRPMSPPNRELDGEAIAAAYREPGGREGVGRGSDDERAGLASPSRRGTAAGYRELVSKTGRVGRKGGMVEGMYSDVVSAWLD
jgi:hypothetical protein